MLYLDDPWISNHLKVKYSFKRYVYAIHLIMAFENLYHVAIDVVKHFF